MTHKCRAWPRVNGAYVLAWLLSPQRAVVWMKWLSTNSNLKHQTELALTCSCVSEYFIPVTSFLPKRPSPTALCLLKGIRFLWPWSLPVIILKDSGHLWESLLALWLTPSSVLGHVTLQDMAQSHRGEPLEYKVFLLITFWQPDILPVLSTCYQWAKLNCNVCGAFFPPW